MAQTLKGTCSMGAANIQAVNQREAVNQRAIDVALAELHRGE